MAHLNDPHEDVNGGATVVSLTARVERMHQAARRRMVRRALAEARRCLDDEALGLLRLDEACGCAEKALRPALLTILESYLPEGEETA